MEVAFLMKYLIEIPLPSLDKSNPNSEIDSEYYFSLVKNTNENWLRFIYEFLGEWLNEKDFVSLKTSGSTGTPKIVQMKKKAMEFSALQTNTFFQLEKDKKALLCLPAEYIGGRMMIVRALLGEMKLFAAEPKINLSLDDEMVFDFAAMIPLQVKGYLDSTKLKIEKIIIGGASISPSLEKEIRLSGSTQFWATYGMTETVSHIALRKINGDKSSDFFSPMKNILIGRDERNCLTIYNSNYGENVIITNDIVEFDSDNCFKVVGRWDNIINSGGLKIVPEELEKEINVLIENRIIVIGIPDEDLGEKLVLLIEGKEWDGTTLSLFKNSMKEILGNKSPKEIHFLEKFSETENGKINRIATKGLL